MNTVELEKRIMSNLRGMNDFRLREVLDFVEFLRTRSIPETPKPGRYSHLRGKYKDRLSPSDEFARSKQLEIELEESKWNR
ncbi:MAG: hypothetical protein ACLFRG_09220 [Desulfococcaceae bacterium]